MPPTPPNAYKPGTQLTVGSHDVKIVKYISAGGYAHVYTCEISPTYNDTKVACLKRVAVPDKVTLNILRAEVDAMKRLKGHRFIVSYIDSHASRMATGAGYEVFLLMEYCSGNGLIDFMNSRLVNKLTEAEVLKIMCEVTEGVCNMHALSPPLIHRDIKIENVLISGNGNYKLCDFGSASGILRPPRNIDEFKILQDDIMKHTTAQYRAPEMIDLYRGFPIDEKSDVWALGVFLYKICYYTTPFENNHINGNNGGGEFAILHAKFQFPSTPHYSSRLKNIISKILVTDPRSRPNAYQVLEEVCKMRGMPVPIENWYKIKSQEEIKPSLPKRPLREAPSVTKPINTPPVTTGQVDPFMTIDKSKILGINGHSNTISAYTTNNSKSQPSLNSNLGTMISSHINDLTKNSSEINRAADNDKFAKPISRAAGSRAGSRTSSSNLKRPISMYVADDYKTYLSSSEQMETLKKKITGPMETIEFEPDPRQHIDSNVDFLRNLSRQDSGRSLWKSQNTGESVKSAFGRISNHNTGTRKTSEEHRKNRHSISSLKSLLTGEKKEKLRPPTHTRSQSKSRTPSFEVHPTKSTDSLSGFQSIYHSSSSNNSAHSIYSSASIKATSRKSSESIKEDPEPQSPPPPQRANSIQTRVKMLLNRTQDPQPQKTASGYGKYTEEESFKKPEIKTIAPIPLQLYKTDSKTSTASTYSTITPQTTTNKASNASTPKSSQVNSFNSPVGASGKPKKKLPPPKPKKPTYLKSPPKSVKKEVDEQNGKSHLVVEEQDGKERRLSVNSDIDVDDLERQFNERFPSAL